MEPEEAMSDKLSKAQQDVIDKLKSGWELGKGTSSQGYWWLQYGKLGHGDKAVDVNTNTAYSLMNRGLIEQKRYGFPTALWGLTEEKKP